MSSATVAPARPVAVSPARRAARRRANRRRRLTVLAFMSPWIVGFVIFFGYPLVESAWLSLNHYDLLSKPHYIGLANYRYMAHDPNFWPGVRNTLWMICIAAPATVLFAFAVAMLLTRVRRGAGFFRSVFYMPTLAPAVAATLGFVYLFNPNTGPVNRVLSALHLPQPLWFDDPHYAKPSLTILGMWGFGTIMIVLLAALLDVPTQLYESAELDGANAWHKLRHITLPTISPVLLFALITSIIDALQYFTQGYVAATVAGGGDAGAGVGSSLGYPQNSTMFYPVWLYQQGFRYFAMGYASAMAMVMLVVAVAFTVLLLRSSRLWVHSAAGRAS